MSQTTTTTAPVAPTAAPDLARLRFVWLEVTGKCSLNCVHCYADSGPGGTHGLMTKADWLRVIDQAAALGAGAVQFIGGEPTMHPDLPEFVRHALGKGLAVEVYSNLVAVSDRMWDVFRQPGVSLATSWYSDDAAEHQRITGGSARAYQRTLANIGLARAYGIPLRAGLVSFGDQQRTGPALRQLARLGITRTRVDHVRGVGRGGDGAEPDASALCGRCTDGRLAVLPDGSAYLCVFSRWPQMLAGNVLTHSLEEITTGTAAGAIRHQLQAEFANRPGRDCDPGDSCGPSQCGPTTTPPLAPAALAEWPGRGCDPDDSCDPNQCIPTICAPAATPDSARSGAYLDACDPNDGCDPNQCMPVMTCDPFTNPPDSEYASAAIAGCDPGDGCDPGHPECDPGPEKAPILTASRNTGHGGVYLDACDPNDGCDPNHCGPDCDPGPDDVFSSRVIAQVS